MRKRRLIYLQQMADEPDYSEWMHPVAERILGYPGGDFGSKSGYRNQFPTHSVIFNCKVKTPDEEKIWAGDFDFSQSWRYYIEHGPDQDPNYRGLDLACDLATAMGPVAFCPEPYYERELPFKGDIFWKDANGFTNEDDADYWQEQHGIYVFHPDRLDSARARVANHEQQQTERWIERQERRAEEEREQRAEQKALRQRQAEVKAVAASLKRPARLNAASPENILY